MGQMSGHGYVFQTDIPLLINLPIMATPKKNNYINTDLLWAEEKLAEWRKYVDDNPINELNDRVKMKQTANGGAIPMVVASIESQIKSIRDTMKEYLQMLEIVKKLREVEEAKEKSARGGGDVPFRMRRKKEKDGD